MSYHSVNPIITMGLGSGYLVTMGYGAEVIVAEVPDAVFDVVWRGRSADKHERKHEHIHERYAIRAWLVECGGVDVIDSRERLVTMLSDEKVKRAVNVVDMKVESSASDVTVSAEFTGRSDGPHGAMWASVESVGARRLDEGVIELEAELVDAKGTALGTKTKVILIRTDSER